MRDALATVMSEDIVEATVELKLCSLYLMPPAMKQQPRTRRMFERMLPSMLAWTIRISLLRKAMMLTYKVLAAIGIPVEGVSYNQFDRITECGIQQTTQSLSQRYSQLFGRKRKQRCQRYDRNEIETELRHRGPL